MPVSVVVLCYSGSGQKITERRGESNTAKTSRTRGGQDTEKPARIAMTRPRSLNVLTCRPAQNPLLNSSLDSKVSKGKQHIRLNLVEIFKNDADHFLNISNQCRYKTSLLLF